MDLSISTMAQDIDVPWGEDVRRWCRFLFLVQQSPSSARSAPVVGHTILVNHSILKCLGLDYYFLRDGTPWGGSHQLESIDIDVKSITRASVYINHRLHHCWTVLLCARGSKREHIEQSSYHQKWCIVGTWMVTTQAVAWLWVFWWDVVTVVTAVESLQSSGSYEFRF